METQLQNPQADDFRYLSDTLYVMGGKWTLLIMHSLALGNRKFSDIKRSIPNITPRVLTQELRKLEENKLVKRKQHQYRTDIIDYEISSYCESLEPIIQNMIRWGKEHRSVIRD